MGDDDVIIEGDLDAWFAALEQGTFLQVWEEQQQRIQARLIGYGEGQDTVYDASQD